MCGSALSVTQDEAQPPPTTPLAGDMRALPVASTPRRQALGGTVRRAVSPAHRRLRARSGERGAKARIPCEAGVNICGVVN